jgi:hypothetical protein
VTNENLPLKEKIQTKIENQDLLEDMENVDLTSSVIKNLGAKDRKFDNVKFTYARIYDCYFRKAAFHDCDFTGAKIYDSNFKDATFHCCRFDYARFSNTIVSSDQMLNSLPGYENVQREFVRSLRKNFESIGDVDGCNKCIRAELNATKKHLRKVALSGEAYYRGNYKGWRRIKGCFELGKFLVLELVWGNGEKPIRILGTMLFLLFLSSIWICFSNLPSMPSLMIADICDYSMNAVRAAFEEFLGIGSTGNFLVPGTLKYLLVFSRYILIGMFLFVFLKRFSRR